MPTDIDYGSLLNDYYFNLECKLSEFLDDVSEAVRWQLIIQTRDLDEDGHDCYESRPFHRIKQNFFRGTLTNEDEWSEPIVFQDGQYIQAQYARLTPE